MYVDQPRHVLGRMVMCHMLADTTAELLAMADAIGVRRRWLQSPGRADEHFDVCKAKRAMAIAQGAKDVTSRELVGVIRQKRQLPKF